MVREQAFPVETANSVPALVEFSWTITSARPERTTSSQNVPVSAELWLALTGLELTVASFPSPLSLRPRQTTSGATRAREESPPGARS